MFGVLGTAWKIYTIYDSKATQKGIWHVATMKEVLGKVQTKISFPSTQ